jgi:hypothetical protein
MLSSAAIQVLRNPQENGQAARVDIQRLEQYVTVGLNEQLKTKVIAILGCLLEVLAISEKYIKDGRFKKYTVAIFLGEDKGVQGAFERLSKLFVSEERLVVAILYANGQKTFEICRGIQETAERIESNTTGILDTVGQVQSSLGEVVAGLHQQRVVADVKGISENPRSRQESRNL